MWDLIDYVMDLEKSWESLTQRQKDCLRLRAEGFSQEEIATLLGISRWTVRGHIEAGQKKLPQYRQNE